MSTGHALEVVAAVAPWVSARLGIATAVRAQQAFHASSQALPVAGWPGDDSFFGDFDQQQEIKERTQRDVARAQAFGIQSIAAFVAAGAAIEAAAPSQVGRSSAALVAVGIIAAARTVRWQA